MTIHFHEGDLPQGLGANAEAIAIDTETMGLHLGRDRLCLVQLAFGDGDAHLVRIALGQKQAPNLKALLEDPNKVKIFHFGRFDIASLKAGLDIHCAPVFCTKIASRLVRTYTDRHGLRDICRELLGTEISKQQQSSDWGSDHLSEEQKTYAAGDVLYLHALRGRLIAMLERENRTAMAQSCFDFLPARADLDLAGWPEFDIFAH